MAREMVDTSNQYLEEFLKQHNISEIPEAIRDTFYRFLVHRAADRSVYLALPEEFFSRTIRLASPREHLITDIEHSRIRIGGLNGGMIKSWIYSEAHPKEHEELLMMDRSKLIEFLDYTTDAMFSTYRGNPSILKKSVIIQTSFENKTITGRRIIERMAWLARPQTKILAEALHAAGLPRTAALNKAWSMSVRPVL